MTDATVRISESAANAIPEARPTAVLELDLTVTANELVNAEYARLALDAPRDLIARCRAGRFFHLRCPTIGGETPYLRRPMSIYGFDVQRNELHFLYKIVGQGTRALRRLHPGDALNVLGPLGNGFHIDPGWKELVLVARGVGLATLLPLAMDAKRLGRRFTAVCSARHPDVLVSVDRFRALGADVVAVTDFEGTADVGNVERIVAGLIAKRGVDAIFTCGSARLLKLLQRLGRAHGIPGQVALEQQMACGLGMCHCCVRPIRKDGEIAHLRVCREGPVFDLHEVIA